MIEDNVIDWLLDGDPVIRWQTMRDLCGRPPEEWQAERMRTVQTGWGARFVECLRPDGTWPDGRWTGTVWTLLTVMDCGLPPDEPRLRDAAHRFLASRLLAERPRDQAASLRLTDLCHLGFWLRIGACFLPADMRLAGLVEIILSQQMPDGGWNCRIKNYPKTTHSSFHTTFNILEGLAQAAEIGVLPMDEFRHCEARALEFMLAHQMYRSDKTGEIVNERFTHLAHPSRWHYTVLRGLDYLRDAPEIGDPRLQDPIDLIVKRRQPSGRWPVEKRIPGTVLFDMEKMGGESRWNTLRALRVLRRRSAATRSHHAHNVEA